MLTTTNDGLLRVARTRERNAQQNAETGATDGATPSQRNGLKVLANAALKRNEVRNSSATNAQKGAQQNTVQNTHFVAQFEGDSQPLTDHQPADPPDSWDRIRDLIHQGYRAEFSPPGPDGRQAITWIPPGAWESEGADQGEPEPNTAKPFRNSYENPAQPVRCGDCRHQEPTGHPALIRCKAGVQASGACGLWWSTDRHQCGRFESATVNVNFVNNDS
jgi:hypothetical protein